MTPTWESPDELNTLSLAWGDVNGDNLLDLAVGNGCIVVIDKSCPTSSESEYGTQIYLNGGDGSFTLFDNLGSTENNKHTESVAWGDMDNDGDLDLAVGNGGQWSSSCRCWIENNYIFENTSLPGDFTPTFALSWESDDRKDTRSVSWGDIDGDGDLDLVAGNYKQANTLYINEGGVLTTTPKTISDNNRPTTGTALGDVDGDGDLDLAVSEHAHPNKLYLNNDGSINSSPSWESLDLDHSYDIAWGDVDNDGDLDLVVGNRLLNRQGSLGSRKVYLNINGILQKEANWVTNQDNNTATDSVAWGDINGDGNIDLATASHFSQRYDRPNDVYLNQRPIHPAAPDQPPVSISLYGNYGYTSSNPIVAPTNFYGATTVNDKGSAVFSYTIYSPVSKTIHSLSAFYSVNGGGKWLPALQANGTNVVTNIQVITPAPLTAPTQFTTSLAKTGTYNWDIFNSGFFGQSDNVVFRLVANYNASPTGTQVTSGTYMYPNQMAGAMQRPFIAAQTFPFRVRGNQIYVTGTQTIPNDSLVYRLPAGQTIGALPFTDFAGKPFQVDSQGFLQGNGEIAVGDTLFAMVPISTANNGKYTVYATNIEPMTDTISGTAVTQLGLQTINISEDNPLILFNLDISLEWDARTDPAYLAELEANLQRASEILFDWTNGQAALGDIRIYHDRQNWDIADVRIQANNRYRPNATIGGVLSESLTITPTAGMSTTFVPGQLRMGITWNRFGDAFGNQNEDWSRAFVHELGHYLLFMDDNYYGFDDGEFISIDSCTGAMANPYIDIDSGGFDEFHPPDQSKWLAECANTASNLSTGQSDWETINTHYSWLTASVATVDSIGPNLLPLAVTDISFESNIEAPNTLLNPYFTLLDETKGGTYLDDGQGQAYIIRAGERLLNIGAPNLSQIVARGIEPNDTLCLQNLTGAYFGCKNVTVADNLELPVRYLPDWQPDILIQPVTSKTIAITLTAATVMNSVHAQLYPFEGSPPLSIVLTGSNLQFSGEIISEDPLPNASIHVWGEDVNGQRWDLISEYTMGGNPSCKSDKKSCSGGGGGRPIAHVPIFSSDGLATIVGKELEFDPGEFYVLQTANQIPTPPSWATVVGRAYRLTKSDQAPAFDGATIQLSYLLREVPSGAENSLVVYYYNEFDPNPSWQLLDSTALDAVSLSMNAPVQGAGLYVVMATITTPPLDDGWNLFAYPNVNARSVGHALASLNPDVYPQCDPVCYTSVYHWQNNQWLLYDQTVAMEHPEFTPLVNTLQRLHPLHSYWIYATATITPLIQPLTTTTRLNSIGTPPATFYGWITNSDFAVGQIVEASVDGQICGTGTITQTNHSSPLQYSLQVGSNGCGGPGKLVHFSVNGMEMAETFLLDDKEGEWNRQAWFHALQTPAASLVHQAYLPAVLHKSTTIQAPDLVVESIVVNGSQIEVTIANVGNTAVTAAHPFWVDLYIDPVRTPTANDTWPIVSTRGAVWGVSASALPLAPGETLKLTTGDAYYHDNLSNFDGTLAANTPIFVQVDSAHTGTTYGAVLEMHEITNGLYNNIEVVVYLP